MNVGKKLVNECEEGGRGSRGGGRMRSRWNRAPNLVGAPDRLEGQRKLAGNYTSDPKLGL